jgi:hypothetical protein
VHYQSKLLQPVWEVMDDPAFRSAVKALPGYTTDVMGQIIAKLE